MFLPLKHSVEASTFVRRPNRFILECRLVSTGEVVTVHLPDPGRLKELLIPGCTVYLSYHDLPHRRTNWSAELVVATNGVFVSLRSTLPNDLIKRAFMTNYIEELAHYNYVKGEYTYHGSRWDFLLERDGSDCLVEVKSVTLAEDGLGYFPDAVTKRGAKHVKELTAIKKEENIDTVLLFVCQREDIKEVQPASLIDPNFAAALKEAKDAGVTILARRCSLDLTGIQLLEAIPVKL